MCEFCKNVETGDDYREILRSEIDCGFIGTLDIGVALCRKYEDGTPVMALDTCLYFSDCHTNSVKVPIKYCPICGEKLNKN